jgi:hypothetical protein
VSRFHSLLDRLHANTVVEHPECVRHVRTERAVHQHAGRMHEEATWQVGISWLYVRADAPRVTRSMQIAMQDLEIDALYVVYPGERRFDLSPGIEAVPPWAVLPPA